MTPRSGRRRRSGVPAFARVGTGVFVGRTRAAFVVLWPFVTREQPLSERPSSSIDENMGQLAARWFALDGRAEGLGDFRSECSEERFDFAASGKTRDAARSRK